MIEVKILENGTVDRSGQDKFITETAACEVCGPGKAVFYKKVKAHYSNHTFSIEKCTGCGLVFVNPRLILDNSFTVMAAFISLLDGLTEHFLVPSKIVFMLQRVYLAPYGVGLGHASRLLTLAENMKKPGIEMRFSSFGEACNYIESQGYECEKVPPVEFMWGRDGEFSVMSNINKIPQWLVNLPVQINKEIKEKKK